MTFSDEQLKVMILAGMSDDEIIAHVHNNTSPADLYGAVAETVVNILNEHADLVHLLEHATTGSLIALNEFIEKVKDDDDMMEVWDWWKAMGLTRADTKNIVMTFLYGSTEYGNRDSILERIDKRADECMEKALDPYWDKSGADMWKDHRTKAVTLMVRLTRGAMAIVCPSTVETMSWIQTIARMLGERDKPFRARTPLGFLIEQNNRNTRGKQIYCYVKKKVVAAMKINVPVEDGKRYNARKMEAGAAPNFIHAFDACHLQMTALATDSEYFHMIHDSMATQCADTPKMAKAIRYTFCDMYADSDILMDTWFLNDGVENSLPEPREMGNFEVELVKESRYFFH